MAINRDSVQPSIAAQVEDLTVAYDRRPVLWDIDINFPSGKLIAIMGPNGAGKSTLIKAMLGLTPRISGSVRFFPKRDDACDESANSLKANRHNIAYVPQCSSVDWDFPVTAIDVVLMGCYGRLGFMKRIPSGEKDMAMDMLKSVGMEKFASRQISQLSGGQQQRLFIARALMQNAMIYFLDEPFKGVDASTERTIMELLYKLRDRGRTIIAVHHDLQTAPDYFDHLVLLNVRVQAQGDMRSVFNEKNLSLAYGSHYQSGGKGCKNG